MRFKSQVFLLLSMLALKRAVLFSVPRLNNAGNLISCSHKCNFNIQLMNASNLSYHSLQEKLQKVSLHGEPTRLASLCLIVSFHIRFEIISALKKKKKDLYIAQPLFYTLNFTDEPAPVRHTTIFYPCLGGSNKAKSFLLGRPHLFQEF